MLDINLALPWVSFCISTYKRPEFLSTQIALLLKQIEPNFEIVISDNDPDQSAGAVARSFPDKRIRYFPNEENMGMIRSFNKSIDRATTEYITMVTDDDPIEATFLQTMKKLVVEYPGYSLYGGFIRSGKEEGSVERINSKLFLEEIIDPSRTASILWSSCILKRSDAILIGKIPDYGSPHLADHALMAMTGGINGGVIINRMYSSLTQHEQNFSKLNLETYITGCEGFYKTLLRHIGQNNLSRNSKVAVNRHLYRWFISCIFNLKRYYTIKGDTKMLSHVNESAEKILSFPFMTGVKAKFILKTWMLYLKKKSGLLRA
jgi:glycosyltransferase involved in cell wall biosynthesis